MLIEFQFVLRDHFTLLPLTDLSFLDDVHQRLKKTSKIGLRASELFFNISKSSRKVARWDMLLSCGWFQLCILAKELKSRAFTEKSISSFGVQPKAPVRKFFLQAWVPNFLPRVKIKVYFKTR